MKLIGLTGPAGCGKNTVAEMLSRGDRGFHRSIRVRELSALDGYLSELPSTEYVVFSDVDTEEAATWLRERGGVIVHIVRPGADDEPPVEYQPGDFALDNSCDYAALKQSVAHHRWDWLGRERP
ncbi:MAG: hypothetical protein OIF55_19240 [Amphritea sp.]|nr:hypothetical protein [Amphritea sp.]